MTIEARTKIWRQVEGEVLPWDLPPGSLPFDRNFWVMDERTGALARFDVTRIARAWDRGDLPNLGLVLRLVDVDESIESKSAILLQPKDPRLIYHDIRPERGPLPRPDGESGKRGPGESPVREEGRGGSD